MPRWPVLPLVLLTACLGARCGEPAAPQDGPTRTLKKTDVRVRVVHVARTDTSEERGARTAFTFDVYLDRLDLGSSQPNEGSILAVDLPAALQPKLMYVSPPDDTEPDSGSMCDRPRVPHRCEPYTRDVGSDPGPRKLLLKITFEDGAYAAVPVDVEVPAALPFPELVEPKAPPAQGSSLALAWKDVEADRYLVEVNLCRPYGNDGINPCLDGESYELARTDGNLATAARPPSTVTAEGGLVRLTSPLKLTYEEKLRVAIEAVRVESKDALEIRRVALVTRSFPKR